MFVASPTDKKSQIERSDERGGQGASAKQEMTRLGYNASTTAIEALAV